jgi:hypothetical protein
MAIAEGGSSDPFLGFPWWLSRSVVCCVGSLDLDLVRLLGILLLCEGWVRALRSTLGRAMFPHFEVLSWACNF